MRITPLLSVSIIGLLVAPLALGLPAIEPKSFKWQDTNYYVLGQTQNETEPVKNETTSPQNGTSPPPPPPQKKFGWNKETLQTILAKGQKQVLIEDTHSLEASYSGSYTSAAIDKELWQVKYDFTFASKISKAISFTVADFYKFKISFDLSILDMTLSLPTVKFVHPQALYRNFSEKTGANPYKLPFDVKLESQYSITDLLKVKVAVTDSMLGDFSKDISAMIEGLANFAYDSIIG